MSKKVNISCSECEATATINFDLDDAVYTVSNCPFCGTEISDDDDIDVEEFDTGEF